MRILRLIAFVSLLAACASTPKAIDQPQEFAPKRIFPKYFCEHTPKGPCKVEVKK